MDFMCEKGIYLYITYVYSLYYFLLSMFVRNKLVRLCKLMCVYLLHYFDLIACVVCSFCCKSVCSVCTANTFFHAEAEAEAGPKAPNTLRAPLPPP